jgi:hypothetical protein
MTIRPPTVKNSKEIKMSGIKGLVGKRVQKVVKFMGEEVKISKLSVAEVMDIQAKAKELQDDDAAGLGVLRTVIRSAVEGGEDLTDEDFETFPMDELSKLSTEVMKFSGIGQDAGK